MNDDNEDEYSELVTVPKKWYDHLVNCYQVHINSLRNENQCMKEYIEWKIEKMKMQEDDLK